MKLRGVRNPAIWSAVAVLVLAGGYFGFHALFVKVSRTVEVPFSGPARHDEFYVLGRYLQARGLRVDASRNWPQPLSADTALFWFTDDELPDDVRTWLAAGGRLWAFEDPDTDDDPWEWVATSWDPPATDVGTDAGVGELDASVPDVADEGDEALQSLLREREAAQADAGLPTDACPPADAGADGGTGTADEDAEPDCRSSADGCLVSAQFDYGTGCLTLVHPYGVKNEQVYLGKTPARIDALLRCPSPARRVLIVSSANSPWFGSLLIAHAPEALLGALVCLALWLWRASRHFGPVRAPRSRARRRLLDHIAAVGRLALRVGPESLIEAARRELRQRLLRSVPGGRELEGAALVAAAVQNSGQPEPEVTRALLEPPTRSPAHILAIARSIIALWRTS